MKYRKDGRVYKLVLWFPFFGALWCDGCCFWNIFDTCPVKDNGVLSCTFGDGTNRVWRETIPSKIRSWIRRRP